MKLLSHVRVVIVGMLMGAAEVVPGVSGGTIAFVSGYYEKLIDTIRQFTPYLIVRLRHDGFVSLWRQLDVNFLLILFGGMFASILLFANGVSYLLENQPVMIWSLFFGLVLASVAVVWLDIGEYNAGIGLALVVGIALGLLLTRVVPINLPPTPIALFFGGAVAVCAWILPGLSGSFILLVLGLYAVVIDAVKELEFVTLGVVAAGCAVGIVTFAQGLTWLFVRYRAVTLAVLTGFMVGSLTKIWPWKITTSYQIKADGTQIPLVQQPILPHEYLQLTGEEPQVLVALVSIVAGLLVVLGLKWLARHHAEERRIDGHGT